VGHRKLRRRTGYRHLGQGAIASGVPLGACIARRSIMDWSRGAHGNTYGGNPLACAAALKTIELLEREYLQNAAEVGQYTLDALHEIATRHHQHRPGARHRADDRCGIRQRPRQQGAPRSCVMRSSIRPSSAGC